MSRIPFQTHMREAAVELLKNYAADADLKLQVYRARPRSILPPTAFVDRMREAASEHTITTRKRSVFVEVVVIHGLFDSGDAVDQRDRFVDGFLDWVADNYHAAGANTLIAGVTVEDDPWYRPEWMPPDAQRDYFATTITLEGYAAN